MDNVRKIAEGLSKTMQNALCNAHKFQESSNIYAERPWRLWTYTQQNTRTALTNRGLVIFGYKLTETGLAVRAYLKDQEHG